MRGKRTVTTVSAFVAFGLGLVGCVPAWTQPAAKQVKPSPDPITLPDGATVLPSGRFVSPAGRRFDLGDFPLGLTVSPNGRIAVALNAGLGTGLNDGFGSHCDSGGTPNGCGYVPSAMVGDPSTPAPDESLSVVDLERGVVTDVTAVPTIRDRAHAQSNSFGLGLTFSPDGHHVYATGGGNNAVYDFEVSGTSLVSPPRTVVLPSTVGLRQSLGALGRVSGYTKNLAVTPDGRRILVVSEFDNVLTVLDAASLAVVQQVPLDIASALLGAYLYGIALSPDGHRAFITAQGTGDVIALRADSSGRWSVDGPNFGRTPVGDHPTAITATPNGRELLVANANDDTLAVLDTATMTVRQRIDMHVYRDEAWGSVPNAIAVDPSGAVAYVALAGDNAVAVLDRGDRGWTVRGDLPVGWYPSAVAVRPGTGELLTVAAKGLGSRYPAIGAYPQPLVGGPHAIPSSYYYDGNNMPGLLSVIAPASGSLADETRTVRDGIAFAAAGRHTSLTNPVPSTLGDPSPIKKIVYIVRENRTFDQVFGDLGRTRTDVDADPAFEVLAAATPNAHSLQARSATSDHFFSDGEASVQGHWWTTGANVNDYVEKAWRQNYSDRARPSDWLFGIGQPKGCSIFQAAARKAATDPTFRFRDYGEANGALNLSGPRDVGGCPAISLENVALPFLVQSLAGSAKGSNDDRVRAQAFLDDVGIGADGRSTGDPASNRLPEFSYLTLPEDHTTGLGGKYTPRAQVAQNDAAVGMIVSALSKSRYWNETAIFVVEDDSQDGPDHVDGHRNVLLTISPWARHVAADGITGGYVSHEHFDQASVLHTIEMILGLPPMSAYDQTSPTLSGLFQNKIEPAELTAADLAPYEVAAPPSFLDESASAYNKPNAAALRKMSAALDLTDIDLAGPQLEAILWQSTTDAPMPAELARRVASATTDTTSESDDR